MFPLRADFILRRPRRYARDRAETANVEEPPPTM